MRSLPSRTPPSRTPLSRTLPSRTLPARPSLRHLKLEAKRRLAAGGFATLHDAQTAIAREHGLPSWARLKQACDQASAAQEGPALAHLRWVVGRFSGADRPGWTPPGEDELARHFDDRFLAAIPAGALTEAIAAVAPDLRTELVVIRQAPLEVQVQLAGQRYVAVAAAEPPHRLGRAARLHARRPDHRPPGEGSATSPHPRRPPGRDRRHRHPGPRRTRPARPAPGRRRAWPRTLGGGRRPGRSGPGGAARAGPSVPAPRSDRAGYRDRGAAAHRRGPPGPGRPGQRPAHNRPSGRRLGDGQGPAPPYRRGGQPRRALRGQRAGAQ